MEHKHSVYDTDTHFVIVKDTREIKSEAKNLPVIVQHDHNSERFSFRLEKLIDGHDMTQCNQIKVHYINIDSATKDTVKGVYEVDDIRLLDGDESKAVCSWLISENATQYAGKLNFKIEFACIADDGTVTYRWNTAIYSDVTVSNGMDNGEVVTEAFPDILAQWEAELFGIGDTEEQQIKDVSATEQAAIAAKGEAVRSSIPEEYTALQAQADATERSQAPAIVLKAEGESVAVNDASNCYLHGLRIFGKSTQDGTPSPDAPVDIVSVENVTVNVHGKNLLANQLATGTVSGVTRTLFDDGSFMLNGTATELHGIAIAQFNLFDGVYKVFGGTSDFSLDLWGRDVESGTWVTMGRDSGSGIEFEADGTKYTRYLLQYEVKTGKTFNQDKFYPMVCVNDEQGSDFEPYKEAQTVTISHALPGIPVSSGGNYTDANGQQWICDEVDLARGVYVQRVMSLTLTGEETAERDDDSDWADGCYTIYTANSNTAHKHGELLCSFLPNINNGVLADGGAPFGIGTHGAYMLLVKFGAEINTKELAQAKWREVVSAGGVVNVRRQDPIETALSDVEIAAFKALHTNKPNTTILNDAGAYMAVEYVADTKTYIDNKIAALLQS